MSKIEDGGPAYPIPSDPRPGAYEAHPGMSLRDWFAGQALAGMIARYFTGEQRHAYAANDAYKFADAMIAARKGGSDGE